MNKNILIVLGGAVAVAVLVAVLVQVTLGGAKNEKVVPVEKKVEVLVAAKDFKAGHLIKKGDVGWQKWAQASAFPGVIKRTDKQEKAWEVAQGRLARAVSAGEPVLKSALLADKGNFVAASLSSGMRAVSVKVSASTMVSGFVGPGDRVDLILTYKESINTSNADPVLDMLVQMNLNKMATETILQNVKVLAVDQSTRRPDDEKIKVGKTVTLEVSLRDAERLALASDLGDLMLVLRGPGDDKIVERSWPIISDARLTKMNDEILSEYRKIKSENGTIENGAGIPSNNVRIYNGPSVEVVPSK